MHRRPRRPTGAKTRPSRLFLVQCPLNAATLAPSDLLHRIASRQAPPHRALCAKPPSSPPPRLRAGPPPFALRQAVSLFDSTRAGRRSSHTSASHPWRHASSHSPRWHHRPPPAATVRRCLKSRPPQAVAVAFCHGSHAACHRHVAACLLAFATTPLRPGTPSRRDPLLRRQAWTSPRPPTPPPSPHPSSARIRRLRHPSRHRLAVPPDAESGSAAEADPPPAWRIRRRPRRRLARRRRFAVLGPTEGKIRWEADLPLAWPDPPADPRRLRCGPPLRAAGPPASSRERGSPPAVLAVAALPRLGRRGGGGASGG